MSESLNSEPGTTTTEAAADLSQNLDEATDLQLGLGALGGLRHSAACDAAERSQRRYDERNHRLHEARMKAFGMEGKDSDESPEAEDMAQQVLIRSPVTHNHHYESLASQQPEQSTESAEPTQQPAQANTNWLKNAALAAALLASGAGIATMLQPQQNETPTFTDTDTVAVPKALQIQGTDLAEGLKPLYVE